MILSRFIKAAPRGLTVAVFIAFALLNGLGIWQMQRLHWKQGLIRAMAQTETLAAAPVSDVLAQPSASWRSVVLPPCATHPDRVVKMHSAHDGDPGFRVLIVCPAADGAVLVDIGFIEQDSKLDIGRSLPALITPLGRLRPVESKGWLMPDNSPERGDWYWRSPAQMGAALGATVRSDYFLVLEQAASGLNLPGLDQGALTAPLENRHLEYALTWFALAWTLMAFYVTLVVQRKRKT